MEDVPVVNQFECKKAISMRTEVRDHMITGCKGAKKKKRSHKDSGLAGLQEIDVGKEISSLETINILNEENSLNKDVKRMKKKKVKDKDFGLPLLDVVDIFGRDGTPKTLPDCLKEANSLQRCVKRKKKKKEGIMNLVNCQYLKMIFI